MRVRRSSLVVVVTSLCVAFAGAFAAIPANASFDADQTSVVSDDPVNNTPDVLDGNVNSVIQIGDKVYVGGVFKNVQERGSSTIVPKANIFAFSASTGKLDPTFLPVLSGGGVDEILQAPDGNLWVAGFFSKVNGLAKTQKIAKIDPTTGAVITAFKSPNPNGRVSDIQYANNTLYIGGLFTAFNASAGDLIAALDPGTGANKGTVNFDFTDTFNGGEVGIRAMDVSPNGQQMMVVGNFRNVSGQSRVQVARFDLNGGGTATLSSWNTTRFSPPSAANFDTYVRDVDYSPDSSYFVIVTTGAFTGGANSGTMCDAASRWESSATGAGQNPTWVDYTGGDTLTRVTITTAAVYIGGHQRWMNNPYASDSKGPGAVVRPGLAALDPRNGVPYTWNPTRARGYGVFDFTVTANGLWLGHDTNQVHAEVHKRLAYFPLAGGTTLPPEVTGTLPGNAYLLGVSNGNTVTRRGFNGTSVTSTSSVPDGGQTWGTSRASFYIDGVLYTGWSNKTLTARTFSGGTFGTASTVNLNSLTAFGDELAAMTGAFYDKATGRLYFTLSGQTSLFYRYYQPQSGIVGGQRFTAQASTTDTTWSQVGGMFLAGGKLYFASTSNGNLYSITWSNNQAVNGTRATLSGPGVDGNDWRSRGLVLTNN
jgi:hypothetical protein